MNRPTDEQLLMGYACQNCGDPQPHRTFTCENCEAEAEQARIDAGEMVACDSCGEETLHNPCQECRDIEDATRDWR